jgi:integrase
VWEKQGARYASAYCSKVKTTTKPGRCGDGAGLYLNVAPSGSKSWVQRVVIDGHRRDLGLGGYPAVSLAQARGLAAANRAVIADGRDPVIEKHRSAIPTFKEAARKVHEANLPRWRNKKHAVSWMSTLERHAFFILGNMRVDRVGQADVLKVLTPIWSTHPETARRIRQRIRTVMRWAMAHGFIENNPAGEAIDGALPPTPKLKAHLRALPYQEVGTALETVEASRASPAAKLCLRFAVLTAARSGEARGALWGEIDFEGRLWTIPETRMKGGVEHRVPLADAAMTILAEARTFRDESDLVFPSPTLPG